MTTIGLYYGTSTGNTEDAARQIKRAFEAIQPGLVKLVDVLGKDLSAMPTFDKLIIGVPTWNIGELQTDWEDCLKQFDDLDLTGTQVALFGLGDEGGYPDTYQDAVGILAQKARERGAAIVGLCPTEGYNFDASLALEDGRFLGLMLDNDNAPDLTAGRITQWVQQIAAEFGITTPATPVAA
jgi:flavodoxin I